MVACGKRLHRIRAAVNLHRAPLGPRPERLAPPLGGRRAAGHVIGTATPRRPRSAPARPPPSAEVAAPDSAPLRCRCTKRTRPVSLRGDRGLPFEGDGQAEIAKARSGRVGISGRASTPVWPRGTRRRRTRPFEILSTTSCGRRFASRGELQGVVVAPGPGGLHPWPPVAAPWRARPGRDGVGRGACSAPRAPSPRHRLGGRVHGVKGGLSRVAPHVAVVRDFLTSFGPVTTPCV